MRRLYAKRMQAWENRLCFRANNRVVRPFDWGLECTAAWPVTARFPQNGHDPETYLRTLSRAAVESSPEFFSYRVPTRFELTDGILRFPSAVETPYPENNVVHAQWFPAKPSTRKRRAVVVLPHWNASAGQHVALCQGMAKLGLSALRISLPYHDFRMPPELERADYAVSSNLGRTIDASRQAVIDVRSCADWLEREMGFEHVGLVGTSLGSCYGYLASAHDPRFRVNVYNHCSTYFADVVWTGLSTRHIRQGLEPHIDLERLREAWLAISPPMYWERYKAMDKRSLFIYARYDTTFPPHLSEQVVAEARLSKLNHKSVVLPCGHYTLGEWPFKFIDGYHICSFLLRNL